MFDEMRLDKLAPNYLNQISGYSSKNASRLVRN
jgi:hypothetical protein